MAIVTNGNVFSAMGLRRLLQRHGCDLEIEVWVTTGLRRNRSHRAVEAWDLVRRWGIAYTAYKAFTALAPYAIEFVCRRPATVLGICRDRGIPRHVVRDVNAPDVVDRLRRFAPDVLVSFSCPYRIQNEVLDLPRIGSMNVHSSLLPAYAGVCTYVHVLAENESVTGVTVHEMVDKFDAGRILEQEEITIAEGSSVLALFTRQCRTASALLDRAVQRAFERDAIEGAAQDPGQRSYRREPGRDDIQRLRRNGHCLMRWDEVGELVPEAEPRSFVAPRSLVVG